MRFLFLFLFCCIRKWGIVLNGKAQIVGKLAKGATVAGWGGKSPGILYLGWVKRYTRKPTRLAVNIQGYCFSF